MPTIHGILANENFIGPVHVEGREAIANLFPLDKRCGIYVLHFANTMVYVGQSVDVTRRYVEHRRNHNDIVEMSFKQVKRSDLDLVEKFTRDQLQDTGHILRGVVGIIQLPGKADFDPIMPAEDQEKWVIDVEYVDYSGSRMINPALRSTYTGRFSRLKKKAYYYDVIAVLKAYTKIGIPRVRASEDSFWSCSCLPKSNVYSRINIHWQEVLSAFEHEKEINFSFHFAMSPFTKSDLIKEYFSRFQTFPFGIAANDEGYNLVIDVEYEEFIEEVLENFDLDLPGDLNEYLSYFFDKYPGIIISNHRYDPGGHDQINFTVKGKEQALQLLQEEDVIRAIRRMNLRLMRMGPCNYRSSHCLDLADQLVYEDR